MPNKAHALNPQSLKLLRASDAQRSAKEMKIRLSETSAWTGNLFDLRIDSGVATFAGTSNYEGRFPATMTLRPETIEQLEGVFTMLNVFGWRVAYRPEDVGSTVDDGGSWSLEASSGGKSIFSRGDNASPSYNSSDVTSLHEERYGLLRDAIFAALRFSVPFGFTSNKQPAEQGACTQPSVAEAPSGG